MKLRSILFIVLLFITPLFYNINTLCIHAQEKRYIKREFVILIDEGHGPFFGYKELSIALAFANESLKYENITIKVYTIDGRINSSTLLGVDLLIIPPTNGSSDYTQEEGRALEKYIKIGGSVLILGAPYLRKRDKNPDLSILNELISSMNVSFDARFYHEGGVGDVVGDVINGEGEIIIIRETYASDELKDLFRNISSVEVSSASIELREEKDVYVIKTPSTSYRVNGDGAIEYNNSGQVIFAAKEIEEGLLALIGFGESFTNLTSPKGFSWVSMEANKIFFANLIKWMLRLDRWIVEEAAPAGPIYLYILLAAIPLISLYPVARRIDKKREEAIRKKKEEIKISEILKKIREKEKE